MKRFIVCLVGVFVGLAVVGVALSAVGRVPALTVTAGVLVPIGTIGASAWVAGARQAGRFLASWMIGLVVFALMLTLELLAISRLTNGATGPYVLQTVFAFESWFVQWPLQALALVGSGFLGTWIVGLVRPAHKATAPTA